MTHFQNEFQPAVILLFIFIGGVLAFLMEMSGSFEHTSMSISCGRLEYLLLVNTSGITLNILGIVKVSSILALQLCASKAATHPKRMQVLITFFRK